ncbi:class I SAM-dependent methyltransferase [Pseudodesulfovibrio sediminis]|uniref:Methyltransferase domain-containing protein n=1 Tax=Pseudodesulfovibrio sediminis TaxID=2810563 RepID=A0ABN6ER04_9BACT|nr:class I SAM-dependent methyltransferase [Pseudodesulfovibrio sediminis]BCS87506.1 hypothetical protein PSDVSF_07480 [Pseudodesulfovibrio sediminis]
MAYKTLTTEVAARIFADDEGLVAELCNDVLESHCFDYVTLSGTERDEAIVSILKGLKREMVASGSHRAQDWEKGWGENLAKFSEEQDIKNLTPGYFSRVENRTVFRLDGDLVASVAPELIYNICELHRTWFMTRYLSDFDTVFEFGCGTGWNLTRFNELRPGKQLFGLDWAQSSVDLVNKLGEQDSINLTGHRFNFFEPDYSLDVPENSVMFTLTALEQVGDDFESFLEFLLEKKFARCVHAEPIKEFYDEDDLLDNLGLQYHNKRNYLGPFLTALRRLEDEGRIVIERADRVRFGNLFNESLSTIVWSPQ